RVYPFAIAVHRGTHVLGRVRLAALTTAPQHVRRRAEFGRKIHVAHHLAQREPTDVTVVAGERTVLEHGVGEQVGGGHRHHESGLVERRPEPADPLLALTL